jgi:hypothetical protein
MSLCTRWSRFGGMRDKFDPISQPSICNRSVQFGQSDQSGSILELIVREVANDFIYSLDHSDLILMCLFINLFAILLLELVCLFYYTLL